jgi:PAS domain S-box-containing protein
MNEVLRTAATGAARPGGFGDAALDNLLVMPAEHPAEFLRAFLDAAPFGVIAMNGSGTIRLWSHGAQTIFGWKEAELIGCAPPWSMELIRECGAGGDTRLVRNDGEAIDVKVWTVPWQEGLLSIVMDNSGHRRAERAIEDLLGREREALTQARAERRFRELLEAAPDAIIEVDSEGRILTMNARTEQLFGYRRDELQGHAMDALVPDHVRANHSRHRANYAAHPQTRPMGSGLSLEARRKNGSTFPVEISLSPVKSEDGFRVTAVIRDITERKKSEDTLRAIQAKYTHELELRNQEVEVANRHKSEFLASMSHELRTPLHTVIGFSELLDEERKGPLNADQKRFIGHIRKDAQHLLALINEVLDLSKIEAGKLQLRKEALDLTAIIEEALSSIRPRGLEMSITIEANFRSAAIVEADHVRLKQILYNLLSNAVKFTPRNGHVCIDVDTVGSFAQVSIQDTGTGISLEEQESVFEQFHQVGTSAAGSREGTGLGLPITRKLVEEHGGRLWLESEPGKGSRFTFTIPLKGSE